MKKPSSCQVQECVASLEDPRAKWGKRHLLVDIVTIALLGVICGADDWVEVVAFGHAKEDWLRRFLKLPNGIPSHDTFGRGFAALDPGQFVQGFARWVQAEGVERTAGQVIALDGKTLRRSHDRAGGKAALHLVRAWAADNRSVLAQRAVDGKSNESTALPLLLDALPSAYGAVPSPLMRWGARPTWPAASWSVAPTTCWRSRAFGMRCARRCRP